MKKLIELFTKENFGALYLLVGLILVICSLLDWIIPNKFIESPGWAIATLMVLAWILVIRKKLKK